MPRSDAGLWLAAVVVSLLLNVVFLIVLFWIELSSILTKTVEPEPVKEPEPRTVMILPTVAEPEPPAVEEKAKAFARSSPDQASELPENPSFIGEVDSTAASDATPSEDGPEMPSQAGLEPEHGEMELTESQYQDGDLAHQNDGSEGDQSSPPQMEEPAEATVEEVLKGSDREEIREERVARAAEHLAKTMLQVDRPVLPIEEDEMPEPSKGEPSEEEEQEGDQLAEKQKTTPSAPPGSQGFRGHQRRTELKGSITRGGRAALDMEAGALGKYHAAISRAIERSWQRQVVRNLDYIKPGVIRVRVVLDENGRVRSVGTVEEFGIGAIQKGFTHNAIREAPLPKMPVEVKRELDGEPLELLYNFIF